MGSRPGKSHHATKMKSLVDRKRETIIEDLTGWVPCALNNLLFKVLEKSNEEFL